MKKIYILLLSLFGFIICSAQTDTAFPNNIEKTTRTYLTRNDTLNLNMDIYRLKTNPDEIQPCMLFVFGGGFVGGHRDNPLYNPYFITLVQHGITVISID